MHQRTSTRVGCASPHGQLVWMGTSLTLRSRSQNSLLTEHPASTPHARASSGGKRERALTRAARSRDFGHSTRLSRNVIHGKGRGDEAGDPFFLAWLGFALPDVPAMYRMLCTGSSPDRVLIGRRSNLTIFAADFTKKMSTLVLYSIMSMVLLSYRWWRQRPITQHGSNIFST